MYYLDTNIIIRFLTGDNKEHFLKSQKIFKKIEDGDIEAEILPVVVAECFYVLEKIYKHTKIDICRNLKTLLSMNGIVGDSIGILQESISLYENKSLDFVDCFLAANVKIQGGKILSFDKKLSKLIEREQEK